MPGKPVIKVGHIRITDHLVLGVTQHNVEQGQEKFNDFELKTEYFVGWNPLAKALQEGSVDAAFILAPLAMELFHSGTKLVLTSLGHKSGSIIIKSKRAEIEKIEDFKGKIVLIPHSLSVHNLLFHRLLQERGLSVGLGKDVIFEVVAPSQIPQIMKWDQKGIIGGFIVAEPYGSQVVSEGYGDEFALSKDIWPDHPCCVVVVREEVAKKNPDAVQEMTNSFVKSGLFIHENPTAAAKIGAKFLSQTEDVVNRVLTEPKDRVTTHELYPRLEDLDTMQTYLTTKINAMSGTIDLEKFVDLQFAKEAGAK